MHDTASVIGARFLSQYSRPDQVIVEVGARDLNGSIRSFAHPDAKYIGVDMEAGAGVDVVVKSGAPLPLQPKSADIVVATSILEHDDFFWITFLDLLRIAKDGGVIYLNAPSNGWYHRHPNDNWRFYPDAGKVLEKWARLNNFPIRLIESFIAERRDDVWNDFVAVFQLEPTASTHSFLSDRVACTNVWRIDLTEPLRVRAQPEDMMLTAQARNEINELQARNAQLAYELARLKTHASAFADAVDPVYRAAFEFSMQLEDGSAVNEFIDRLFAQQAQNSLVRRTSASSGQTKS